MAIPGCRPAGSWWLPRLFAVPGVHADRNPGTRAPGEPCCADRKNLEPQLLLANRVIAGILSDLPSWRAERDGLQRANRRLQAINDTLIGIRPILVIGADGDVIASSNETLVGMNFAQRDYFQTAIKNPDPGIFHVSAPFKTVLDTFVISLFRTIPGPMAIRRHRDC